MREFSKWESCWRCCFQGPHSYLEHSLAFLRTIEDAALAQGVASLLWQTFLAKKMEALANTMEKVKKVSSFVCMHLSRISFHLHVFPSNMSNTFYTCMWSHVSHPQIFICFPYPFRHPKTDCVVKLLGRNWTPKQLRHSCLWLKIFSNFSSKSTWIPSSA